MAIEDLFPKLIAKSVKVLRENSIMPRLINTDYAATLAQKGTTVDVPIASSVKTREVTPGHVPPATDRPTPTIVPVTLDQYREAPFVLTDKDISSMEADGGYLPKQLEEAGRALANDIDSSILALYKEIYGFAGTPGTTPFATNTREAQDAVRVMSTQLCPKGNRALVIDEFAYANAIGLDVLQRVDASGSNMTLREAVIGRALGFEWAENQNILRHTAGTGAGYLVNSAAHTAGASSVPVDTGTGTILVGDIFTVAGHDQTYVVKSFAGGIVNYAPEAVVAFPDNAAITIKPSHVANLAIHRDFAAFASRAQADIEFKGGSEILTWPDPVSGVVLRLEVSRQHYQTSFALSCMWGCRTVRPQLGVRLAG